MAVLEFEFKGIDQNFRSSASNVLNDIDKIKKSFGSIGVGIGVDLKTALDGQKVALNDTKIQTQELVKAGKELDNQNKQTRNSIAELTLEQKKLTAEQRASRANLQDSPYSRLSRELNEMRNEAKNLGAQMILLDNAGMKSGVVYNTLSNKFNIAQKSANSLDNQIKSLDSSLGQNNRRVGAYGNALGGLQQKQSGANGVTMEFNRIIQDAPFGMMGIGNNLQQLASNWGHFTNQMKEANAMQGKTTSTAQLLGFALGGIISPINLLTLGIAAVTSGWVMYEKYQQQANKSTEEAKKNVVDLMQVIKEQISIIGQASAQAQANYASEENKLKSLWKITQDATSSVKARGNALNELKNLYPSIFEKYDLETIKTKNATNAYLDLTKAIQLSAKARSFEAKLAEQFGKQFDLQQFIKENKDKFSNMNRLIAEQKQFAGGKGVTLASAISNLFGNQENQLVDYNKGFAEFQKTLTELGKTDDEIKALTNELDKLYQTQANGLGFGDFKKGVDKTNNSLNKTTDKLKEAIDYLKELQSLSGVSEKDISLVGKVGLDFDVASIKFDYEERIKKIQTLQEQILADTTLTEAKRQELIEETNTYIAYLTGNVLANIKDLSNKATEYLDRMTVKAVKTYKDVEIAESPKQKQGRNREDDKDWKDYANILNQSVNSVFTNLKSNIDEFGLKARSVFYTLGESLGDLIKQLANKNTAKFMEQLTKDAKSFSDLKDNWKNMSSQDKWSAGLGFAGSAVSSLTPQTSSGGQAVGGALSGAAAGMAFGPWGAAIGAVAGGVSGLLKASKNRRQEKILLQQYEEQKKANALLERMNALTYASQIIGQKTEYGIVSGVRRNEFGQIVSVVQGQDIIMVADRTNKQKGR